MTFMKGHAKAGGRCLNKMNYTGRDVRVAARFHTEASVAYLSQVVHDPEVDTGDRIFSAVKLLEFGWGKPAQTVEATVAGEITNRMAVTFELSDLARPGSFIEHDGARDDDEHDE